MATSSRHSRQHLPPTDRSPARLPKTRPFAGPATRSKAAKGRDAAPTSRSGPKGTAQPILPATPLGSGGARAPIQRATEEEIEQLTGGLDVSLEEGSSLYKSAQQRRRSNSITRSGFDPSTLYKAYESSLGFDQRLALQNIDSSFDRDGSGSNPFAAKIGTTKARKGPGKLRKALDWSGKQIGKAATKIGNTGLAQKVASSGAGRQIGKVAKTLGKAAKRTADSKLAKTVGSGAKQVATTAKKVGQFGKKAVKKVEKLGERGWWMPDLAVKGADWLDNSKVGQVASWPSKISSSLDEKAFDLGDKAIGLAKSGAGKLRDRLAKKLGRGSGNGSA